MRMCYTPVLLAACLCGPGCSFVGIIKQNLYLEPKRLFEDRILIKRHERLAQLAWEEMIGQYGCQFSEDYHTGFIDGFVDFLTFGSVAPEGYGNEPMVPAVPPPHYRRVKALSPENLRAADDWFAGFRHGSSTAQATGLRKLVEVPVFDRPRPAIFEGGRFRELGGSSSTGGGSTNPAPTEGETLPAPRSVPAGEPDTKPANPPAPGGLAAPPGNTPAPGGPAVPPTGPVGTPPNGTGPPPPPK
jgi:hypothetical protein